MKTGLVTDSIADIPPAFLEKYQIEVVPSILVIDGKEYVDGEDITREEFYARMPTFKSPATTAALSTGEFKKRYQKLFNAGAEQIFSIHAAAQLSGIFNAARLAAESFTKPIHVIDSNQLSLGIGFQVLEAAEALQKGATAEDIKKLLTSLVARVKLAAALDTLEYLRRSGRVSWTKARVAKLLSLKPMIALANGTVENLGAVRTTRLANIRLLEMLQEAGKLKRLAILHTNAEERAKEILAKTTNPLQAEPLLVNVTPVIGAHLGPGGVGFTTLME